MRDEDKTKRQLIDELGELRQRLAAWQETEARARCLLETVPLGVAECDTEGVITLANPAYEEMTGYSSEDLVGMRVADLVQHGPQSEALLEYFEYLISEQPTPSPYRCKDITKDGRVIDVQVDWAYKRNPEGQVTGFISIISDITERKRAEETLRESETRFRSLFQDSAVGTVVATLHGGFLQANRAFCAFLGYSEPELLRQTVQSITHPEDREATSTAIRQALTSGPRLHRFEKRYLHKNGQVLWGEVTATLILNTDGTPGYFITQVLDVTERKRAEAALQEAHDELERRVEERTIQLTRANEELVMFRRFAEASSQGFSMADLDGHLTYLNPTLCQMLGEDRPEDRIGQHLSIYYSQESNRRGREEIEPALKQNGHWEGELPMLSRQGTSIPTWHSTFMIRDEKGVPLRLAVVITDISERKRAEEALERERQSLWKMLQASDHERQIISYEIHDGLAQYLGGAIMQFQAHDILTENSPDKARKAYETALELVRQSHAESRRLISEVRPPVIDEDGLETALSHLVHEQRRHGGPIIKCDCEVQFGRLPVILENAIYRIAQEALANACKHSKSKKVTVAMTQEGQEVRLAIQDWGVGFDPVSVEKGHFGLEGIRQRVRLLGGRLNIESTPGSGTLVQVVVPIVERPSEE